MEINTKPTHIIILSDGKEGHTHQSLAVAAMTGLSEKKIIPVHYKRKFCRIVLALWVELPLTALYCKTLLWLTLKKETFKTVLETPPGPSRLVISAGSGLNAVNLAVSCIHKAKSIVIMRPPFGRQKKYDLRIIPEHDNPKPRPNTLITAGAPTLIGDMNLDVLGKTLADFLGFTEKDLKKETISLCVGGNSPSHTFTKNHIEEIIRKIKFVCESTDTNLLLTTSRRTPKEMTQILKKELSLFKRCKLFVVAGEPLAQPAPFPPEHLIAGIMGLSQLILVTEDSISMISEAASSGKKVIVIEMDRKPNTKHDRMIKTLLRGGYISSCQARVLDQVMLNKIRDATPPKVLQDSALIKRGLEKLLSPMT